MYFFNIRLIYYSISPLCRFFAYCVQYICLVFVQVFYYMKVNCCVQFMS